MVTDQIRKVYSKEELPIILVTSMWNMPHGDSDIPTEACLYKPLKPTILQQTLLRFLVPTARAIKHTGLLNEPNSAFPHKMRILLAEDNVVNQKVASNMLKHIGLRADIASNGLEAISALEIQRYDIILMDVQMPEMDGILATMEIRKRFAADHQPYIVALTANALVGDREKYLTAGMDDYISKPVKLGELRDALHRALESQNDLRHSQEGAGTMLSFNHQPKHPLELSAIYDLIGMEDFDLAAELIELYIDDSFKQLDKMAQQLADDKLEELGKTAHTLKGSSASIGVMIISHIAAEIEPLKSGQIIHNLPQLIAEIKTELDRLKLWWASEVDKQSVY
jgi:CheY-like chemotaxis protein/HPt (histidine-containing phosphotransfer) domain-containing protein